MATITNYSNIKSKIDDLDNYVNAGSIPNLYVGDSYILSQFHARFGTFKLNWMNFMPHLRTTQRSIEYNAVDRRLKNDSKNIITEIKTKLNEIINGSDGSTGNSVNDIKIPNLNKSLSDLSFNINLQSQLTNSENLYDKINNSLDDKSNQYSKNKELNKRITQFYSKNTEFKKDLLYYAKMLYYIILVFVVFTFFRKKFYKKIFPYIFIIILLLIPNVFIKILYKKIVDGIGHFKLDFLYIISMTVLILIISALFSAVSYLHTTVSVSVDTQN